MSAVHGGAIFSYASPAGTPAVAKAARGFHSKEHVAASGRKLFHRRVHATKVYARCSRPGDQRREAYSDCERQSWPRVARRTPSSQGYEHGNPVFGSALSAPASGN